MFPDKSPRLVGEPESTISVTLDKVDILVPIPKPKLGTSSLDTVVCTHILCMDRIIHAGGLGSWESYYW
jgi:hypothetical protein